MRRLGIRARIVTVTTGVLALALLLGAVTLAFGVWQAERAGLDDRMRSVAAEVGTLVDENRLPTTLPVSGSRFVQVVDSGGAVVSASLAADRLTPLLSPDEIVAAHTDPVDVPAARIAGSGTLRVLAQDAGPESRRLTVLVAAPVEPASQSQRGLWLGLAVGAPLVLLLTAALLWRAVGAALAPVDRLRVGAERIGVDDGTTPLTPAPHHVAERIPGSDAARLRGDTDPTPAARGSATTSRLPVPEGGDEIAALAVTLNGMLDRLDEAASTQRRFVADAAHELRSPVASLRMQIEVAEHIGTGGDLPAELRPDVDRLGRLVDDLLLLARAGSSRSAHEPEPVDLVDIATRVAARHSGSRVPVQVAGPSAAWLEADRQDLDRVLTNLVDNAMRHARTAVDLRCRETPTAVILDVLDDGPGIPAADRERVFERFTRLDEARSQDSGGSGLGLPIVRELLRRNGGEVTLLDRPDDVPGLLARVTLPRP